MEQIMRRRCVGLRTDLITRREKFFLPIYSLGEEIFSAVSHGVAALVAVGMYAVLLTFCRREPQVLLAVHAFGISMILLYTVSTIYHALAVNRGKAVFRVLDHCTIFLLIAGTYTPITLGPMLDSNPALAWSVFGVEWGLAALGITLNAIDLKQFGKFSMICYLGMGWMIVVSSVIEPLPLGGAPFMWLLLGGIAYTVGAVLYGVGKRVRYMHSVFHLFVLLGSILQSVCVIFYVMRV